MYLIKKPRKTIQSPEPSSEPTPTAEPTPEPAPTPEVVLLENNYPLIQSVSNSGWQVSELLKELRLDDF